MTILDNIARLYPNLPKSQRMVARFAIAQHQAIGNMMASEVAERVGVDAAIITRFIQNLGYASYADFARDMQALESSPETVTKLLAIKKQFDDYDAEMTRKWRQTGKLITVKQAMKILGLSHQRIYQLIYHRRLPAKKIGRDWLIDEGIVQQFKETHSSAAGYPKGRRRGPVIREEDLAIEQEKEC